MTFVFTYPLMVAVDAETEAEARQVAASSQRLQQALQGATVTPDDLDCIETPNAN